MLFALFCTLLAAAEFPQRPLMQANEAGSMMHRYLAKPVHESLLIDDMESDHGWTLTGIGSMGYTSERAVDGKRSLRFRTLMRDEKSLQADFKNGTFAGDQGGASSLQLTFAKPQDWSRYNRISLWVYIHPSTMRTVAFRLRVEWEGFANRALVPNPSHFVQDLEPGRWHHVVWEIPDLPRHRIKMFTIRQVHTGHDDADQGEVVYDFDRLEVQRVDAEPWEGWEVAPGRIAFQHVGYRPSGQKLAFAAATGEPDFELQDAATGRTVASFPAKAITNHRGRFAVLDFSSFTRPGRYRLRYGKAVERPFAISGDLWYGTIEKALNFYYGERCGFDVPGIHRVCHKDWRGRHDGITKFINGGWHDAGDLSQGSHRTGMAVYSMLRIYDQLHERHLRPNLQERVLEEAKWGLDWLLKTRFGDGYRITWLLGRFYTDNRVGTVDDMLVPSEHIAYENFLFSAVAAHAAGTLKTVDAVRAAQSLQAAEEDFHATLRKRGDWKDATRDEAAFGALAAAELYRATGKAEYATEAAHFARLLLQCQEQRFLNGLPLTGFFYTSTARTHIVHDQHLSFEEVPLLALNALCKTFPSNPDWINWYAAALLHSEYYFNRAAAITEPYRSLPSSVWPRAEIEELERTRPRGWDIEGARRQFNEGTRLSDAYTLRAFPIWHDQTFHGNTAIQMSGTAALTIAATLRNSPAAEQLAARQLAWVFGDNPFSQSLMYGEGYDFQPHFAYCLKDLVGSLPVGMDSRRNDLPCWPATNTATYKEIWVVPVSRLLLALSDAAMPARVTGKEPATFRERKTGALTRAPTAPFDINLPPGDYDVTSRLAKRKIVLLPGATYNLRPVEVTLTSREMSSQTIEVEAKIQGPGKPSVELNAFNANATRRKGTNIWTLAIQDPEKPWIAVVTTGNDFTNRQEIYGTLHYLPELP